MCAIHSPHWLSWLACFDIVLHVWCTDTINGSKCLSGSLSFFYSSFLPSWKYNEQWDISRLLMAWVSPIGPYHLSANLISLEQSWPLNPLIGGSTRSVMYVCIEATLRVIAHCYGRSNWAKGRGPSGSWIQCPNPAVPSIPRHAH